METLYHILNCSLCRYCNFGKSLTGNFAKPLNEVKNCTIYIYNRKQLTVRNYSRDKQQTERPKGSGTWQVTEFLLQHVVDVKTLLRPNGRLEKFKAEKSIKGYIYTRYHQEATESLVVTGWEIPLQMIC